MNKNMTSAAMGVAAVALAYAVMMTLKKPTAAGARSSTARLSPVVGGGGYNPANPGGYVSTDDLIYGVVAGSPWDSYASTDDLINQTVYGNGKPRSVVRLPGGYW